MSKELWFSPQILQRPQWWLLAWCCLHNRAGWFQRRFQFFLLGGTHWKSWCPLTQTLVLRFKYLISKGIWVSSVFFFFFFWIHKGQTLLGEQGKMGWERKLRKQKKWVFCFVVLLFCFNIYFPPTNWVFTAHSVILTILKAELGEQGQCRKAAITQKDLFYQWELSGCQLGAARALMRTQRHKVVSVPSANAH